MLLATYAPGYSIYDGLRHHKSDRRCQPQDQGRAPRIYTLIRPCRLHVGSLQESQQGMKMFSNGKIAILRLLYGVKPLFAAKQLARECVMFP